MSFPPGSTPLVPTALWLNLARPHCPLAIPPALSRANLLQSMSSWVSPVCVEGKRPRRCDSSNCRAEQNWLRALCCPERTSANRGRMHDDERTSFPCTGGALFQQKSLTFAPIVVDTE